MQVYLLQLGFSFSVVMLIFAVLVFLRLSFRQGLIPFVNRFGLRASLIIGTAVTGLSYVPLALLDGLGPLLVVYLCLAGFGEAWYWTSYHALTAQLGDNEKRGQQTSAVQLIYAFNFIAAPLIGGTALSWFGPLAGFGIAALAMCLSLIPLLGLPILQRDQKQELEPQARRFAWQIYGVDGFTGAITNITSRIVLFMLLGQSFQALGSALAFAGLFGAVLGLVLGRLIDVGHGKLATGFSIGLGTIDATLRAVSSINVKLMVGALAFGAATGPIYGSAYNSRVYNISQKSGDTLRFQSVGEGGWDVGAATGSIIAAGLAWFGVSWFWIIGIGIFGTLAALFLLLRSFNSDVPQSD